MQHSNDQDTVVADHIDNQMLPIVMDTNRWLKTAAFDCQFGHLGQHLKFFIHPAEISRPLFPAPSALSISGDAADIPFAALLTAKLVIIRRPFPAARRSY